VQLISAGWFCAKKVRMPIKQQDIKPFFYDTDALIVAGEMLNSINPAT
jgi:uncharacterized Fe-S center protein